MILHNIRALAVVCWLMCVKETVSQEYAPAPTLKYPFGQKERNELNSIVSVTCTPPWGASYPVTLSVGKLESPTQTPETTEAWQTSKVITSRETIYFTISATAKFEGEIVCWYKSTEPGSKNPYSAFSNNITLVISSLAPPRVTVHPELFLKGGNYTVQCETFYRIVTNFTLSLYYRILPVTSGTDWTLVGSVFLTNGTSIITSQTNAVVPIELGCLMSVFYNGKVIYSPLSAGKKAIPEVLPVRLWEQSRGESCLGFLDVTLKEQWQPVCQKEAKTEADSSAAAATAEVVCRQRGCGPVLKWARLFDEKRTFTKTVGGIRCSGKENAIIDCPVEEIGDCEQKGMLYIICSDALPYVKLSVDTYGSVSKLYVKDIEKLKISCNMESSYLNSRLDYGLTVLKRDGVEVLRFHSKPHYETTFVLKSPIPQGVYECEFHLSSSKMFPIQRSNSVFLYTNAIAVPIIAGVLTTAVGLAILAYICMCRTVKKEVHGNEFPQANTENPDNTASNSPQQLQAGEM